MVGDLGFSFGSLALGQVPYSIPYPGLIRNFEHLVIWEPRGVGGAGALYTVAVAAMSSNVRVNHFWSFL